MSAGKPHLATGPGYRQYIASILPFVLFAAGILLAPRLLAEQHMITLIYIGISALLAVGLNLLMGYAGQISLGHAAFFGIGAYVSAIVTVRPVAGDLISGIGAGIGAIAGAVAFISLTRASGWRLAVAVISLGAIAWSADSFSISWSVITVIYAVVFAAIALACRLSLWKCVASGVVAGVSAGICRTYLSNVLAAGGTSPWSGMLAGVIVTCLIAYLIGGQVLRLKGHYLAMATLGFGIIIEIVFKQWTAVTGGSSDGIYGIPSIDLLGPLGPLTSVLQSITGRVVDERMAYYFLVWTFVFIAILVAVNIVRSRVGRAFRAVHGSEVAAESLGVDTGRYKVQVFVFSAALASIAGSLHAHNAGIGYINPVEFSFFVSVQLVVMVVVGGMASVWGALMGAGAIEMLKNWLLTVEKTQSQLTGIVFSGLEPVVFGSVLIIVMVLLPQGLARGLGDLAALGLKGISLFSRKKEDQDASSS